jgi:hypothetical protein
MSISSLLGATASPPLKPLEPSPPKPPDVNPDVNASAPQPVVQAALPPGQGTRVNQLV